MIEVILKVFIILVFLTIFWQDIKERQVYWFLYPVAGIIAFLINVFNTDLTIAVTNTIINIFIAGTILIVGKLYSGIVLKKKFINSSIGVGDILMLVFLSATFATISYIILLVFSLIFSLLMHLIFKKKDTHTTVPLAGYLALFFTTVYSVSFFIEPKYLFSY
ncbi:general secretion pathway protein [Flavobacterium salilacus subsp. salilacus]|uniref:general secretion pathway protein n=1 Tax=Flavobacterium TaxID=237 RepID=UPI0010751C89|nr:MULTISPECIES: general secretion pathway protein [Flavobacterium]KAF2518523.1 general secretion pathway protein [Flavobacterium salilacus subsp. salilacus]MBE1615165.1 general secretion pathway protein [Flavobacterium sp. SaA2.13]